VRITNNENADQYFKFGITEVQDESGETSKIATVQEYMQDPVDGQWALSPPKQYPIKSKLDIRFNVGSSLPFAKVENRALAEKLYDKGIIDEEEFLTQLEYPNKEKIIERFKQKMEMQAQMQQQMPPQGGAPAPQTGVMGA
jgi:hypothetical protein